MPKRIEIRNGKRYDRLKVIKEAEPRVYCGKLFRAFFCICDCGEEKEYLFCHLQSGKTSSCGCKRSEILKLVNTTHSLSGTPEHRTWKRMKGRCYNNNHPKYHRYGARGIVMCDRWLNSFENFYKDMGKRPTGRSIDRINNDGDYCPENCRWGTVEEQMNNMSTNLRIVHKCDTKTLAQWARHLNTTTSKIKTLAKKNESFKICL